MGDRPSRMYSGCTPAPLILRIRASTTPKNIPLGRLDRGHLWLALAPLVPFQLLEPNIGWRPRSERAGQPFLGDLPQYVGTALAPCPGQWPSFRAKKVVGQFPVTALTRHLTLSLGGKAVTPPRGSFMPLRSRPICKRDRAESTVSPSRFQTDPTEGDRAWDVVGRRTAQSISGPCWIA